MVHLKVTGGGRHSWFDEPPKMTGLTKSNEIPPSHCSGRDGDPDLLGDWGASEDSHPGP